MLDVATCCYSLQGCQSAGERRSLLLCWSLLLVATCYKAVSQQVRGDRAHLRLSDILETNTTVMDTLLFARRWSSMIRGSEPQFSTKKKITISTLETGGWLRMIRGPELLHVSSSSLLLLPIGSW